MQTTIQNKKFKKKMVTRSKTALGLIIFYILFITFCLLSSDVWFKDTFSKENKFIFSICDLVILTPIIIFACKEITKLSFTHKKIALLISALVVVFFTWGLGLFYTINRYFIIPAKQLQHQNLNNVVDVDKYLERVFFINILLTFLGSISLFLGSLVVVYFNRKRSEILMFRKSVFWFPVLMSLVGLFFPTVFCVSINYQWTTFVFLIALSNLSDVFAYLGGSAWGRVKLIEKVSPKKTIEGLIFSFVVTSFIFLSVLAVFIYVNMPAVSKYNIVYSILGYQFGLPKDVGTWWWWIIAFFFILCLLIVSTLGDLFFSYIKRQYRIKDFSNLLPGHGGVLDRLDAVSFVFSIYYFFSVAMIAILPENIEQIRFFWLGTLTI